MTNSLSTELSQAIDNAKLSKKYWATFFLIVLMVLLEVFDFVLISFLVADLSNRWELTFGQSSIMLLSFGVGAIVGALSLGWCSDRFGRKFAIVGGGCLFSISAAAIALVPEGNWVLFSALRFLVGLGYAGAGGSQFALIVEYTPTRHRTLMSTAISIPASLGIMLASGLAASLLPVIGWRGVAALGGIPFFVAIAIALVAPESARWLAANKRYDQAKKALGELIGKAAAAKINWHVPAEPSAVPARYRDLLAEPRLFWLIVFTYMGSVAAFTGVLLWGPTILMQLLNINAVQAAAYFVSLSIAGLSGRIIFTYLANRIGRLRSGYIHCYVPVVMLAAAGLFHTEYLWGVPVFYLCLLISLFFLDGGIANIHPYAAEVYPVKLAARGVGVGQSASGIGKILGPLILGLVAGTGNVISPKSTAEAILPGFLLLSLCVLISALALSFLGQETHRKPLRME